MKSKQSMTIFFIISFLHFLSANLAHPITPTLILGLNLPGYMFGAAFAAMAFTNFLFSPFWGKMREFASAKKLLLIGSIGYGIGQYFFGIAETEITILTARSLSGFFVGAIHVSSLIYITEMSGSEETGVNLAKFTIYQALGGAAGFLIGGSIGIYSLYYTFLVQAIVIILCGLLYYFLLADNTPKSAFSDKKISFQEINPIQSFLDSKSFMTPSFALLFAVVGLSYIGSVAFDQSFNYFLKAQLELSSFYNGLFKALIGIITLITNSTICIWIIKKYDIKKATAYLLGCCTLAISLLFSISSLWILMLFCLLYFSFHSIFNPLLQDSIAGQSGAQNRNRVMGFYNAIRSLGMIIGALLSGFIYDYNVKLPFLLAAICFLLATVSMIGFISQTQRTAK